MVVYSLCIASQMKQVHDGGGTEAGEHVAHLRSCTCCGLLVPWYISGSESQAWRLLNLLVIRKPRAQEPIPKP